MAVQISSETSHMCGSVCHGPTVVWAPQVALEVKNPPANAGEETRVQSLGREDPLEEILATHSSILAWRIPWTEEPGGLQSLGCKEPYTTVTHTHTHPRCIGMSVC